MGKLPPPGACPALSEPLFRAIVGGLFFEARVPNGSIIDADAHMGFESCYYAGMSPLRTVHAVEPLSSNVAFMKRQYSRSHPNLTPLLGGLGSSTSTLEFRVQSLFEPTNGKRAPWSSGATQDVYLGARARRKTCRWCAIVAHAQLVQGSGPITRGRRW